MEIRITKLYDDRYKVTFLEQPESVITFIFLNKNQLEALEDNIKLILNKDNKLASIGSKNE